MKKIRYSRIAAIPEIGDEGVASINNGKVLVIGCGALGSLCAMYLAGSGVGTIGIADFDTIDISNLQRQLFFDELSLGRSKCDVLYERIRALNSEIKVNVINHLVKEDRAMELFRCYDFIIDGSDNPATKLMTARVCERIDLPYCIGGVRGFSGQVMSWSKGHAGYTEIFGDIQSCSGFTPCSVGGVIGPAAGVVASMQASEAIKHLTGKGKMLYDSLFTFDMLENSAKFFNF